MLQQYPEAVDVDYSTPLTKDELLEISIQAAQLIGDSEDKLATLKQLSQSFPKYASSIARRVTVNEGLAEEVQSNMEKVQGGINAVWLNGAPINDDNMNPFSYVPSPLHTSYKIDFMAIQTSPPHAERARDDDVTTLTGSQGIPRD